MAKTTLKPWKNETILVEIESTKPLSRKEEVEVSQGIRRIYKNRVPGEPWPDLIMIKQVIQKSNSSLVEKLIAGKYFR